MASGRPVKRSISTCTVPAFQKNKLKNAISLITFGSVISHPRYNRWVSKLLQCTDSDVTVSLLWCFLPTDTLVPLIRFPVLLRCAGFAPACWAQHLVAAAGNLMHPHNVHDVQADTGADPGYTATPGHQVEGLSAVDCTHTTVVDGHDGDADHEKDYCHCNAIRHVWPRGLGIT